MMKFLVILALVTGASALKKRANADSDERPIAKVINMLKDMQAQLEKEAAEDAEAHEEMSCWCETGYKDKAKAIKDAEARIADLESSIDANTAKSQQCATDIESLETQISEGTSSLESATGVRDKERAEFVADEKDMIQSITSLKGAVVVMSKAHGEGFLQVKSLLKHHTEKHRHLVMGSLSEKQRRIVMNLLQEHSHASTPASGEIFGVLKQMKESFETNLANSQKEETQAEAEYEQLKAAKTSEIAAANGQKD